MSPLVQVVHEFLAERNWLKQRPADLSKSIVIESAELLEVFQWIDLTPEELQADPDPDRLAEVRKELADIFIYCVEMCILLKLDPETIVKDKLKLAAKKYPAEIVKHLKPTKKMADDGIIKIKKAYREGKSG